MDGTAKFLCKCTAPDLLSSIISVFCRSYFSGAENSLDLFLSQVGSVAGWGLALSAAPHFVPARSRPLLNGYNLSFSTYFGLGIKLT